jgi:hypothetical protein
MAVDTAARRLVVAHYGRLGPVIPDGTVSAIDRSHLNGIYSFVVDAEPPGMTVSQRAGGRPAKNRARNRGDR